MDLQTYLHNSVKAMRKESFDKSDQLTLGEMILKMEAIVEKYKDKEDEPKVKYAFGYLFPDSIRSWRGIYAELALGYTESDFDKDAKQMSATEFLDLLKETVGKTFEGYKGGDFTMSKNTPVWVDNYGNCSNTAVIDIVDADYSVVIITAYRES